MENFKVIEFHKTRDFSQKLNATFEFIKQNFKSLGKSILFISGPPVVFASLVIGSLIGDFGAIAQMGASGGAEAYFTSGNFWLQLFLMMFFLVLSGGMNIATIYSYVILYGEKRTNQIPVSEVWNRVQSTFWMYLSSMLLLFLLLMLGGFVLAMATMIIPFIGVLIFFCAFIYFLINVSLLFIIRAYEKIGFFDALARSFRLVTNKWWSTFGVLVILYFIVIIVTYFINFIQGIVLETVGIHQIDNNPFLSTSSDTKIVAIVFFAIAYLIQMVLTALPTIGTVFQYFNLVELKESKGLMNQIDSLGKPLPSSQGQDEHF
ncbi:hypothetical protein [Chryseolinea sp. H1M3-3]|uniref:hypothetical protein n=1 Tax=Chryseolinea sp. H1M3-3 TaxID=3034144 RepID=UPI0023ED866F|nr:hypothetical protein [Chryseolinea sp. H1M3-3]